MENELRIGDKVDLFMEKPPYYRTIVEDMADEARVYVSIPTYRGITVILREEQVIQLYYYRQTGRYCVDARVNRLGLLGKIRVAELELLSPPRKEQRRQSYRVPVRIKTAVYPPTEDNAADDEGAAQAEREISYTKDLSEAGLALIMKTPCEVGEKLLLEIDLPLPETRKLRLSAQIRRVSYDESSKSYRAGLEFLEVSESTRTLLARYIFMQQQRILRQKRLVEGE